MKQFWKDVAHEFKRSGPRMLYFLKTGHLHPEVRPDYGIWPKYEIVPPPEGVTGTFTLSYGGISQTRRHDLVLLEDSDPGVNWALQWANTEAA